MAPTFPTIDSATLKALRKGDVKALEKIHRSAYAAVIAEAERQGGDPSLGPPVAELAMITVWEGRANIESAEELEQAIHAAVRGGVTREVRRRAANKGEAKAAAGTVESTWSKIRSEVSKAPAAGGPKHTGAKHHVEKVKSDGGRGGMIAVAVLLIGAAAVGGWYVLQQGAHGVAASSYTLPDAKPVNSTAGQRAKVPLGPGDTMSIGSDSHVVIGGDYGTKVRAVRVDGSASFLVSNGPRFEVNAKDAAIFTSGGTFAVRAYKDEPTIIVLVKDGEVKIDAAKDSKTVTAGKSMAIAKDGTMSEPAAGEAEAALSWVDGNIVFKNTPMKTVLTEYARWFNLPVTTKDSSLLTRPVTLTVALGSNKEAISGLEDSSHVKFTYDKDSKPVLVDAPEKPAAKAAPAKKKGK